MTETETVPQFHTMAVVLFIFLGGWRDGSYREHSHFIGCTAQFERDV